MSHTRVTRALAVATLLVAGPLAGCADETGSSPGAGADGASSRTASAGISAEAEALLAAYDLDGLGTVEVVDRLDRLRRADRPADLMASVRPDEVVVSAGGDEVSLPVPADLFYLSVAPYVDQTHECFHHSLTTCTGELSATEVEVRIVDETRGDVLVEETRTTFANGFTGFWLPRGVAGTLEISYDGKRGETDFATDLESPTCLTTLQLT